MRFLVILMLLFSLVSHGQIKKGDKKFKKGEFNAAIDYYKKDLDDRQKAGEANFMIAECYRVTNRIKESEPYYEAAVKSRYADETATLWYA